MNTGTLKKSDAKKPLKPLNEGAKKSGGKSSQILNGEKPDAALKSKSREWFDAIVFAFVAALILRTFVIEAFRIPTGSMENTLLVGDFLLVNKFVYGAPVPFTDVKLPALKKPEQGDIVVFKYPRDKEVAYIKRCIAAAGSTLEIKARKVYVDGEEFALPPEGQFIGTEASAGSSESNIFPTGALFNKDNYGPLRVPKAGDVIVLTPETINTYKYLLEYEGHTPSVMDGKVLVDNLPQPTYRVGQDYYFMMGDNRDNSLDSRYWGFVPEANVVGSALIIYWSWDPEISFLDPFAKIGSVRWGRLGNIIR